MGLGLRVINYSSNSHSIVSLCIHTRSYPKPKSKCGIPLLCIRIPEPRSFTGRALKGSTHKKGLSWARLPFGGILFFRSI